MQQLNWVKPNRCDNSGPNCVEVAADKDGTRYVRSSEQPNGPAITFTPDEWSAFEESIVNGQRF